MIADVRQLLLGQWYDNRAFDIDEVRNSIRSAVLALPTVPESSQDLNAEDVRNIHLRSTPAVQRAIMVAARFDPVDGLAAANEMEAVFSQKPT